MSDGPERPYGTLSGDPGRPLSEEHYDAVHMLVIHTLRKFAGSLVDDLRRSAAAYERGTAEEVMSRAYLTSMYGQLRLMGQAEVVEFLELKHRRQLGEMRRAPLLNFPAPIAELRCGPIWLAQDIEHWAPTWKRKAGRPRKTEGET